MINKNGKKNKIKFDGTKIEECKFHPYKSPI